MAFRKDPDHYYRLAEWDRFSWMEHGFGSRDAVWPAADRCATLKQIHSAEVLAVNGARGWLGSGDALISNQPGPYLCVRTADCVPILLADPTNRAVAAIHAGWRGTVAEITAAALRRMSSDFGTKPAHVEAAIGPSIGVCCYEVGKEVACQFESIFPERIDLDSRTRIDLAEANRRQLLVAGVRQERIFVSGLCTRCKPLEFHSFRRDTVAAGRLISLIALR